MAVFAEKGTSGCGFLPEVHLQPEETKEAGSEIDDLSLLFNTPAQKTEPECPPPNDLLSSIHP